MKPKVPTMNESEQKALKIMNACNRAAAVAAAARRQLNFLMLEMKWF